MRDLLLKNIILGVLLLLQSGCGNKQADQPQREHKPPTSTPPILYPTSNDNESGIQSVQNLELPLIKPGEMIVYHTGYTLSFNETYEQANWVAYELTEQETNRLYDRTDKFLMDPSVRTGTATDSDYKNSGYDRGHLAPAADMGWSSTTMAESFYYSNMSPQLPGFNRGVWKRLEELVRTWAVESDAIYVVTGPVLTTGLSYIGWNQVAVPNYYYKVILDYRNPEIKAIGFILPNASSSAPLQDFAVSIDKVEQLTGINFFHLLPDKEEDKLEASTCSSCWTWKSAVKKYSTSSSSSPSSQCTGITQAGNRCKRMTKNPNGKCFQHD